MGKAREELFLCDKLSKWDIFHFARFGGHWVVWTAAVMTSSPDGRGHFSPSPPSRPINQPINCSRPADGISAPPPVAVQQGRSHRDALKGNHVGLFRHGVGRLMGRERRHRVLKSARRFVFIIIQSGGRHFRLAKSLSL